MTSITDRAQLGDDHNKLPLHWYTGAVATVGAETDRVFTCEDDPGSSGASSGGTAPVTDVPLMQGDGTTNTAQLVDTSGNTITAGFTVSSISVDGTALDGAAYAIGGTGLVTFATAPASGA